MLNTAAAAAIAAAFLGIAHAPMTLAQVGRTMPVPQDYIRAQSGRAAIEVPEVYELANIILALTPSMDKSNTLLVRNTPYYSEVVSWFGRYRHHPAVLAAQFPTDNDYPSEYQRFRDNSIRYCFDAQSHLYECVPLGPLWADPARDRFTPNLKLVEQFALDSNFRQFFKEHRQFYAQEVKTYTASANIRDMQRWLEGQFDARVSSYLVAASPLIDGFHATDSYHSADGRFREAIMFTSTPIRLASTPEPDRSVRIARTVFTEIDHNYINPTTDRYEARVRKIFGASWSREWPVPGYGTDETAVFNEYLTWAAFLLYARDRYDSAHFAAAMQQTCSFMEEKRPFLHFRAFAEELLRLHAAHPEMRVDALYPAMLDWSADYLKGVAAPPKSAA